MFVSQSRVSAFLFIVLIALNVSCHVSARTMKSNTRSFDRIIRPSFSGKCQQFLEGEISRQQVDDVTAVGKRFLATGWGAGGVDEDQPGGKGATKQQPLPAKRFLATGWNAGGGDDV